MKLQNAAKWEIAVDGMLKSVRRLNIKTFIQHPIESRLVSEISDAKPSVWY